VRWWLNTEHQVFSVDNASAVGMDYSALPANLWMVQWHEGKGEIEYQTDDGGNENGLRESFIDIVPYAPYFQQFLRLMKAKNLLLNQAKKVQIDLLRQIFESKRQMPYHYPVAAGDYWWDATDETLFSSVAAQLQMAIASINSIGAKINSLVSSINAIDASICQQVNSTVVGGINSNVVAPGDALTAAHNDFLTKVTNGIYQPLYYFVEHFNSVLGTHIDYDNLPLNTINNRLQRRSDFPMDGGGVGAGLPGLAATLPTYSNTVAGPGASYGPDFVPVSQISYGGGVVWTPITDVPSANAQWIPFGGTVPVNVTPPEQSAIMQGIAARTNDLNVKKNTKIGEVNALTVVDDVIDYDVTTGW
jgi:hypothetical protein